MNFGNPSNTKIEKIADLPFYTEGPAIDSRGNIYCSTLSGGSILKIDARHKITEWARLTCPNGQVILPDDDHLVCDNKPAAIRRLDREGRFMKNEIEEYCRGVPVYSPNDLITDSDGNIYFTDSIRNIGKVCFLGTDGQQRIVAGDLDYPNGLLLSPDQEWLYVAESYKNRIIKMNLKSPGIMRGGIELFAELPKHESGREQDNLPDGLTSDSEGNLWVAHYGMQAVHCLSPRGGLLFSINTRMPFTSNLVFAAPQTLIITGGYGEPGPGALFRVSIG